MANFVSRFLILLACVMQVSAFLPTTLNTHSSAAITRSVAGRSMVMYTDQRARRRTGKMNHYNADANKRRTIMSSPLSPELRKQHNVRSMPIRREDIVTVQSGDHKSKSGKVVNIDTDKYYVHIEGITREKNANKDGKGVIPVPIRASKVMITEMKMDKTREEILQRKAEGRKAHMTKFGN